MPTITFRHLREDDLPMMYRWLNQPFVYEWFGKQPPSMDDVCEKYLAYIEGRKPTLSYIFSIDSIHAGYVQSYLMSDYPEYRDLIGFTEPAAMFDIFIGESDYIHKGYGPTVMSSFLEQEVFRLFPVNACLIGPDPNNRIAIRAYEKTGFRYFRTITSAEGEQEYIMALYRKRV